MAVLGALVGFTYLFDGFSNRDMVERVQRLLGTPYTVRQASYDLRRLRRKRLVRKIEKRQRYELTADGRRVAVLFTKTYHRLLCRGLALLALDLPAELSRRDPLTISWHRFNRELDAHLDRSLLAA